MKQDYKYYAFISYSRKDEKYAKWVQSKLESYKLPSKIAHDNPDLKKGIRPIFLDKTDLGAGVLYESLGKELAVSQYLIVISSPTSAVSEWVDKETREFLKTHTADHVIPFIVNGTPNSNDDSECFNPAIKEITPELLGVNIQEIGKQQALTKVVAKLLNLSYDALWQRHQRQEKRKKVIWCTCAALLVCIGLFIWDYNRPKYKYYASIAEYADGWLPKGIVCISKEQMQHRFQTYRFTYRQQKLREVALVNSTGKNVGNRMVCVHPDREAIKPMIQHYNSPGDLLYVEEFSGILLDRIDFSYPPEKGGAAFGFQTNTSTKTEIRRFALTRNAEGYVVRKEFKRYPGVDAVDVSDAEGIFGYEYDIDSIGQILTEYFIDNTGLRVSKRNGVASIHYTYDSMGNVVRERYLDVFSKPHFTNYGGAETIRIFDEYGNNVCESYLDENGEKSIAPFYGYATFKTKYDKFGNKIEQAYYDTHDSLCMSKNNVAIFRGKFDERGNCVEEAFFSTDGKPCMHIEGYAKNASKYDKRNHMIEKAYFGIDGKPCLCKYGYAKLTQKHDKRGSVIEEAYYSINNEPCVRNIGFAKQTLKYDERGNLIEIAFFGIDGKPCLRDEGFAKLFRLYDERGNVIEETYFGIDGKLCLRDEDFAKLSIKYDERGNVIEETYFGIDGQPCLCGSGGYAKLTQQFDERGNAIEEAYFGIDEEPCLSDWECAKITQKYDERGFLIEEAYFDTEGRPCLCDWGYAKLIETHDEHGNLTEEAYFGIDGKPCLRKYYGVSRMKSKYDEQGRVIEQSNYGIDNEPCITNEGFHKNISVYDKYGNLTEEMYYGVNGKFCNKIDGYAKVTREYDERGNELSETFWNIEGKRCMANYTYTRFPDLNNNLGFMIKKRSVASNGVVRQLEHGYSKFEGKYNSLTNKLIEVVYYDTKDNVLLTIDNPEVIDN